MILYAIMMSEISVESDKLEKKVIDATAIIMKLPTVKLKNAV